MKPGDSFIQKLVEQMTALYDRFGREGLKSFGFNEVCLLSMAKTQELDRIKADFKSGHATDQHHLLYGKLKLELLDLGHEIEARDKARTPQRGVERCNGE